MAIPTTCKMPDLSGLKRLIGGLFLVTLIGDPGTSPKVALHRRNFVRLVDKALREYCEARQAILDQIAEANRPTEEMERDGRYIVMVQFTDHIETCINATARLFKLLKVIKAEQKALDLPRESRKLLETADDEVRKVRDVVEHMDSQVQKDGITGKPIMLCLNDNDDSIKVSDYEIGFDVLAMVLTKMHEAAQSLLTTNAQKDYH